MTKTLQPRQKILVHIEQSIEYEKDYQRVFDLFNGNIAHSWKCNKLQWYR